MENTFPTSLGTNLSGDWGSTSILTDYCRPVASLQNEPEYSPETIGQFLQFRTAYEDLIETLFRAAHEGVNEVSEVRYRRSCEIGYSLYTRIQALLMHSSGNLFLNNDPIEELLAGTPLHEFLQSDERIDQITLANAMIEACARNLGLNHLEDSSVSAVYNKHAVAAVSQAVR